MTEFIIALDLVARIDHHLTRGTRHFRDESGRLLTTLDQVIEAQTAGRLGLGRLADTLAGGNGRNGKERTGDR